MNKTNNEAEEIIIDAAAEPVIESTESAELSRTIQVERLTNKYVLGAAGVGLIPLPIVDFAALTALQIKMLKSLTDIYDVEFKDDRAKYIIGSLVGSVVPTGLAGGVVRSFAMVPVIGPLFGATAMPLLTGASTYALARVMVQHLESGGTFLTFDPQKVKGFFKDQFESGKQFVKKLGKSKEEVPAAAEA
jgi:uncharacterized protein (DUF697 family)